MDKTCAGETNASHPYKHQPKHRHQPTPRNCYPKLIAAIKTQIVLKNSEKLRIFVIKIKLKNSFYFSVNKFKITMSAMCVCNYMYYIASCPYPIGRWFAPFYKQGLFTISSRGFYARFYIWDTINNQVGQSQENLNTADLQQADRKLNLIGGEENVEIII